jgi:hypothetical protein
VRVPRSEGTVGTMHIVVNHSNKTPENNKDDNEAFLPWAWSQ